MGEKINFRRTVSIIIIYFFTFLFSGYLCFEGELYTDEWLCIFFIDIVFLICFTFEIECERKKGIIAKNNRTTFIRIAIVYIALCGVTILISYGSVYFKPIMILSIVFCTVSNETLGMITGIYFNVILSMTLGGEYYEVIAYSLLVVLGAILAKALFYDKMVAFVLIIIFSANIIVPSVFYYWNYKEMDFSIYLKCGLDGLACVIVAYLCAVIIFPIVNKEVENKMLDIVSDEYSIVKELQEYSTFEYNHAKKVSIISAKCAQLAKLDETLCLVAGFYYRLGKWQGEPHVQNGINRAEEHCFPDKLIQILSEYYGEEKEISMPESALVQIVDSILIKLEYMKKDVGKSQWNNEIMIYQILNEYSSKGLYDKSGLSMNQFLKIREFLVKEESLK